MSTINNKIHQAGEYRLLEIFVATGSAAIYPGMLVEQVATGCRPHSTAGGVAERLFAQEDSLQGGTAQGFPANNGLSGTTFTGYTVTGVGGAGPDPVRIAAEMPGSVGMALCLAGVHYTVGMKLISNGNGTLKQTTGTPAQTIATVVTDNDLSASGAVDGLVQVRYM